MKKPSPEYVRSPLQERYHNILEGRIDEVRKLIPTGELGFPSSLVGVDQISLIPGPKSEEGEDQLSAVLFCQGNNDRPPYHVTASLFSDGTLSISDRDLQRLGGLSRDQVLSEILDACERMRIGKWYISGRDVLGNVGGPLGIIEGETPPPTGIPEWSSIDHLGRQPELLFGFLRQKLGLAKGYAGFVFRNAVYFEHPEREHALYKVILDPSLDRTRYPDTMSDDRKEGILQMLESRLRGRQIRRLHEANPEAYGRWVHPVESRQEDWRAWLTQELQQQLGPGAKIVA